MCCRPQTPCELQRRQLMGTAAGCLPTEWDVPVVDVRALEIVVIFARPRKYSDVCLHQLKRAVMYVLYGCEGECVKTSHASERKMQRAKSGASRDSLGEHSFDFVPSSARAF